MSLGSNLETAISEFALVGTPNSGKSSVFNYLTGARQKTGNYPGITVEKREGSVHFSDSTVATVLDLPGTYSLDPTSIDQKIVRDTLFSGEAAPKVLVAVADAASLEKSLALVLEVVESARSPVILALNMVDLANARGLQIDLKKLESELGCKVVPTVGRTGEGIEKLKILMQNTLLTPVEKYAKYHSDGSQISSKKSASEIAENYKRVDEILASVTVQKKRKDTFSEQIDKILLHPVLGLSILAAVLFFVFQAIFSWAEPFMDFIESGFSTMGDFVTQVLPPGPLQDLLVNGIIAGVGGVLVFLPQILFLFFFIILLEESGYLARAAFLLDKVLRKFGLHGKAFIPLLSGHACAIPGIMAARTIESHRDRLITILVTPLVTCSARLPVYALLIAAFIPDEKIFGWIGLQGTVFFALYCAGMFAAIIMALMLKNTVFRSTDSSFILELPSYKLPSIRNLVLGLLDRAKIFLKRAGTLILSFSILLWFLSSYPKSSVDLPSNEPAINRSYAGIMGHALEPFVKPIGFDWRIATGMVPGFAAREVMVAALATVYAVETDSQGEKLDDSEVESKLTGLVAANWSFATGMSLLIWYVFSPQCLATVAVIRRETASWKWAGLYFCYALALAYGFAFFAYHLTLYLGG